MQNIDFLKQNTYNRLDNERAKQIESKNSIFVNHKIGADTRKGVNYGTQQLERLPRWSMAKRN